MGKQQFHGQTPGVVETLTLRPPPLRPQQAKLVPAPQRPSQLLARAHCHPIALVWSLLSSTVVVVAGCLLIVALPALQHPIALTMITATLCAALGYTLLVPLAAWFTFAIFIYDDKLKVRELRGLKPVWKHYPYESTVVGLERWPWEFALGSGTILLQTAAEDRRLPWVTPVDWYYLL